MFELKPHPRPRRRHHLAWLALPLLVAGGCLDARPGATAEVDASDTRDDDTQHAAEVAAPGPVGASCLIDEDCEEGLICGVDCEDWCDQTQWPNPCCVAACAARGGPWTCPESLGLIIGAAAPCPEGTTEARDPRDFVADPAGNRCCLHDHCDWGSRTICEASSACRWRLAEQPARPNDGACEPEPAAP